MCALHDAGVYIKWNSIRSSPHEAMHLHALKEAGGKKRLIDHFIIDLLSNQLSFVICLQPHSNIRALSA